MKTHYQHVDNEFSSFLALLFNINYSIALI